MGVDRSAAARAEGTTRKTRTSAALISRRPGRDSVGDADGCAMARHAVSIPVVPDVSSALSAVVCRRDARTHRRDDTARPLHARRSRRHRRLHRRHVCAGKKGGPEVGKCRAGKATKVMAIADRHGLPLAIAIAGGNRHDVVLTDRTLDAAFVDELPPRLIGDKAWDSKKHARALATERGVELIAPLRTVSKRKQDGRALRRYQRRWKVERLFAWLKQFRRIATRWERKAENYLGFLHLGCAAILLRHF